MAKFLYNNAKNVSINHILLELNYGYHIHVLFEKDTDSHFFINTANKLVPKF